jgi:hypothetical protein
MDRDDQRLWILKTAIEDAAVECKRRSQFEYGAVAAMVAFAGATVWGMGPLLLEDDSCFAVVFSIFVFCASGVLTWTLAAKIYAEHQRYARSARELRFRTHRYSQLVREASTNSNECQLADLKNAWTQFQRWKEDIPQAPVDAPDTGFPKPDFKAVIGWEQMNDDRHVGPGVLQGIHVVWAAFLVVALSCFLVFLKHLL